MIYDFNLLLIFIYLLCNHMKKIVLYLILLNLSIAQAVISGFITNSETGESLIGANVFIPEKVIGVTSDKNGFYSILIDESESEELTVVVQYLGYNSVNLKINNTNQSISLDFELIPASIKLKSTEIIGEKEARQTETPYSSIKITQSQLSAMPSLAEADVFRTIQGLPGVLQSSEFKSSGKTWNAKPTSCSTIDTLF